MNREQREAVRMGKVDFVVTRDKTLSTYNYRLISKEKFYLEGKVRVYYLYELIPPDERQTPPQLAPVPTYENTERRTRFYRFGEFSSVNSLTVLCGRAIITVSDIKFGGFAI